MISVEALIGHILRVSASVDDEVARLFEFVLIHGGLRRNWQSSFLMP
jgi:hypothetical protein